MTPAQKIHILEQLSYILTINETLNSGLFELYTKLSVWEYCYQKDVHLLRDVRKTAQQLQTDLLTHMEHLHTQIQKELNSPEKS